MTLPASTRLKELSNKRLADTSVYQPIDYVRDYTIRELLTYMPTLLGDGGGEFDRPYGKSRDIKSEYLKKVGVVASRYALVAFGRFEEDETMRALPMYADYEGRKETSLTGSYHIPIWNDYYDRMFDDENKRLFTPARGMDSLSGEAVLVATENRPYVYLRVPSDMTIEDGHMCAMKDMSDEFPMAKYALWAASLSAYVVFDQGQMRKVRPSYE